METFDFEDGNGAIDENTRRANRIRLALLKQAQRMQDHSLMNWDMLNNRLESCREKAKKVAAQRMKP